jgi:FkbM family methyltransferase
MVKALRQLVFVHRAWRYALKIDPAEIRSLRSVLRPGDLAIDVGAYKGGYTYWMRRAVGVAGAVLAFEPQPGLAAYLRRCASDFRWKNVHVEEIALSSEPGARTLWTPGSDPSPAASVIGASLPRGRTGREVEARTLDDVLARHGMALPPRLIKCDVEGHELDVFRGAARTLREYAPTLLFECEPRHLSGHGIEDVFAYLEELGYRGSFFWEGRRLPVAEFDARRHQVQGRRPYANNFVFTVEGGGPS